MRHDWIDAVLADLHDFACRNDLPAFARKVEEARDELWREVTGGSGDPSAPVARPVRQHH